MAANSPENQRVIHGASEVIRSNRTRRRYDPGFQAGAGVFIFLLCVFVFTARGYLSTYDYYSRFLVTRSIVEKGTLAIQERVRAVEGEDGRFYSRYGLGESLLFIPLYAAGKLIASASQGGIDPELAEQFTCSMLFPAATAGTGLLLYLLAAAVGFRRKTAFAVTLLYGFATLAWPYSKMHTVQPLESFFLLYVFYESFKYSKGERKTPLGALSLLLIAAVVRATAVLGIVPALILLAGGTARKRGRSILFLAVGALFPALVFWAFYNYARFGSAAAFGYWSGRFADAGMLFPTPIGVAGLIASPGRGLVPFMPFLLLLPVVVRKFAGREPRLFLAVTALLSSYLLVYGSFSAWYGTESWGARYLVPVIPLLVLPFGYLVEDRRKPVKLLFCLLIGISFAHQLPPVLVSPGRYFNDIRRQELKTGEPVDTVYSLADAGWVRHWRNVADLAPGGKRTGESRRFTREEMDLHDNDPIDYELHDLANSRFNFWWLYVMDTGIPRFPVFVSLLILAAGAATGALLVYRGHKGLRKGVG